MEPLISDSKPQARAGLRKLYNARVSELLSWVANPLDGLRGKEFKSFHVRHEASLLELFFDLFFVANLSTFTSEHEITTSSTLYAYIGFFALLWCTWFQITIFDVRFAGDSVFERCCKFYQFVFFTMLAVTSFTFEPGSKDTLESYRIYQALAIVIGLSRLLLAIQYVVVGFFIVKVHKQLLVPFILIVATLCVSGIAFFATQSSFKAEGPVSRLHYVWWVVLPLELISILTVSSIWRMLSFKESHINERLSLLTMIIIGEGVIGSTRTAGATWPTNAAPSVGGIVALVSVVILLLFIWQIYFDNHPHGHYGTIKQQWWAASHFFLHLGFVGIVEGSNRVAVFYNALWKIMTVEEVELELCVTNITITTVQNFVTKLNETLQFLDIEKYSPRSYDSAMELLNYTLNPDLGDPNLFCGFDNDTSVVTMMSDYFVEGILEKFGIEPPKNPSKGGVAHTFRVTYSYLWLSYASAMLMLLIFLWIVRTKKRDSLELIRLGFRLLMVVLAIGMALIGLLSQNPTNDAYYKLITSPFIVTLEAVFLGITILFDRMIRKIGTREFEGKFAIPPPDHNGHEHEESQNDSVHDIDDAYYQSGYEMTPVGSDLSLRNTGETGNEDVLRNSVC